MVISFVCLFNSAHAQRSSVNAGINSVHAQVPAPLTKGKKAFISYELGAVTAFPDAYSGSPERAYSEFYGQMKVWGRYQLVDDPKDADVKQLVTDVQTLVGRSHPKETMAICSL